MKARPLLAAPFVVDGLSALLTPTPHVEKVERVWQSAEKAGLPALDPDQVRLVTRVSGALSVGAAIYFVVGKHKRAAAALLAGMTVPLALINAPVWQAEDKEKRREAGRTLTTYGVLCGAMLLASVDRVGEPSLLWMRRYTREQHLLAKEAAAQAIADAAR